MKTIKRLLSAGLSLILIVCISISLINCQESNANEKKKYDVTIRIACEDGGIWTFPPDVEEMRIEREYDGREHRYYIHSYQLVGHPTLNGIWSSPYGEGANVFGFYLLYTNLDGEQSTELTKIKDKGDYIITVNASSSSNLWVFREIYLYIAVK